MAKKFDIHGLPLVGYDKVRENPKGLKTPHIESSACGVGFIANVKGESTNQVIVDGGNAQCNQVHRGAVSADLSTGDGAGVTTEILWDVLAEDEQLKDKGLKFKELEMGVTTLFLPKDHEDPENTAKLQEESKSILNKVLANRGIDPKLAYFREVPTDTETLGQVAKNTLPDIQQLVFNRPDGIPRKDFEKLMWDIKADLEQEIAKSKEFATQDQFRVISSSSRIQTLGGRLRSDQVNKFFRDFQNPLAKSSFYMYHNRFSTNTESRWDQFQPFGLIAHNGEMVTIKGNMMKMVTRLKERFGEEILIDPNASDSCRLDIDCMQALLKGQSLLEAMLFKVKPAYRDNPNYNEDIREEIENMFRAEGISQEAYSGPGLVVGVDPRMDDPEQDVQLIAHSDLDGLRPACRQIIGDGKSLAVREVVVTLKDKAPNAAKGVVELIADLNTSSQESVSSARHKISTFTRSTLRELESTLRDVPDNPEVITEFLAELETTEEPEKLWAKVIDGSIDTPVQIIVASEFGVKDVPAEAELGSKNLPKGGLFLVDLEQEEIVEEEEAILSLAKKGLRGVDGQRTDYEEFLGGRLTQIPEVERVEIDFGGKSNFEDLNDLIRFAGVTKDQIDSNQMPVIRTGKSQVTAMNPGLPDPGLRQVTPTVSDRLKQLFAQVTCPSKDSVRGQDTMSLEVILGPDPIKHPEAKNIILESGILNSKQIAGIGLMDKTVEIETLFVAANGHKGYKEALEAIGAQAVKMVEEGAQYLVLTDKNISNAHPRLDTTDAIAAVDLALKEAGLRLSASIIADQLDLGSGHKKAVAFGVGANAVYDRSGTEIIRKLSSERGLDPDAKEAQYHKEQGGYILNIMSKIGICELESFQNARQFEGDGLYVGEDSECAAYYAGIVSTLGGHDIREFSQDRVIDHMVALWKKGGERFDLVREANLPKELWTQYSKEDVIEMSKNLENPDFAERIYWFEVQRMFAKNIELIRGADDITRKGVQKERAASDTRQVDADVITGIRKIEADLAKAESQAFIELANEIAEIGMKEIDATEIAERAEKYPDFMRKVVVKALTEKEMPGYLLPRQTYSGRYKKVQRAYFYSEEELEAHDVPDYVRKFYSDINKKTKESPVNISDLLEEKKDLVAAEKAPSVASILKKSGIAAMSEGALDNEGHTALAAMGNGLGMKTSSGEGGERAERYAGGEQEDAGSKIKQLASGRFGANVEYFLGINENGEIYIEVKNSQGAKPGEGGHLVGSKVDPNTARKRMTQTGEDHISSPEHKDKYSIEDEAQLYQDLMKLIRPVLAKEREKNKNNGLIVKLTATEGVDIVALGVAKALDESRHQFTPDAAPDTINIGGGKGGTGGAKRGAIDHAGQQALYGVAKTHQRLVEAGYRDDEDHSKDRVKLKMSGDAFTPQDSAIGRLFVDEVETGTTALIKMAGCDKDETCNTSCSAGLAADGHLWRRANRVGELNMIQHAKLEAEILQSWGFSEVEQARGQAHNVLQKRSNADLWLTGIRSPHHFEIDRLLEKPVNPGITIEPESKRYIPPEPTDRKMLPVVEELIAAARANGNKFVEPANDQLPQSEVMDISTCERGTGVELAHVIFKDCQRHISDDLTKLAEVNGKMMMPKGGLPYQWNFRGYAGNSFGTFDYGLKMRVIGKGSNNVGKGMCEGELAFIPDSNRHPGFIPEENDIISNSALYGASGGRLYARGGAGNKFAVNNYGVEAVVNGNVGDDACEGMMRGSVMIMGDVGRNFGSGMRGGVALLYDPTGSKEKKVNNDRERLNRTDIETVRFSDFFAEDAGKQQSDCGKGKKNQMIYDQVAGMLDRYIAATTHPETGEKDEKIVAIRQNLEKEIDNFTFVLGNAYGMEVGADKWDLTLQGFEGQALTDLETSIVSSHSAKLAAESQREVEIA